MAYIDQLEVNNDSRLIMDTEGRAMICISVEASSTATATHGNGTYFIYSGKFYKATQAIAVGDTITVGTNCVVTSLADAIEDIQVASSSILEYSSVSSFPAIGESGKIYIDTSTNIAYRWSGSAYVPIGSSSSIIADDFSTSTAYSVGDYVIYGGDLYRFTSSHSAGAWNSSHVTQVNIGDELDAANDAIALKASLASPALTGTPTAPTASSGTNTTQIATTACVQSAITGVLGNFATYQATTTAVKAYKVGEFLTYNGYLYRVTTAIASGGTITPGTNCVQTNVGDEMANRRLWFKNVDVHAVTSGYIIDLSDSRITSDYILEGEHITWGDNSKISSLTDWSTDTAGHFIVTGTCSAVTTATFALVKADQQIVNS